MAVDDLWYLTRRGPNGERIKSQRYGRGRRWRVRYTDPDTGLPKTELFDTKPEAELHDVNTRADISRGLYVDPKAGKQLVAEYLLKWRREQLFSPRTLERVTGDQDRHVVPILGSLKMGQVRDSHIKAWVKDRAQVLSPSSLGMIYTTCVAAPFAHAASPARRIIPISPCYEISLPELEQRDLVLPTTQQVYDLCEALPARYRMIPLHAAGTGWRGGEIFGSELSAEPERNSLDLLRKFGHVRQQIVKVAGEKPYLGKPKTAKSARTNQLPDLLVTELAAHLEKFPAREVTISDRTNPRKVKPRTAALVYTTFYGTPVYGATWSGIWPDAVKRVGLPKGFGLHGLRHFFATRLIFGGANVKEVQLALGHSTPVMTLNAYVGYWPEAPDTVRAILNGALKVSGAA